MQSSDVPSRFPIPFGNAAGGSYIRTIPEASQIGIQDGAASLTDGFPPLNFTPVGAGGVPPFGQDFNGLMKQVTQWARWQAAGNATPWDSAFSTAIGGYPRGSVVTGTTGILWQSTTENNTTNPNTGGAGWVQVANSSAVQSGTWNYAAVTGTVNAITATLSPAPASLTAGLRVILNITSSNTGAATLDLNGLGVASIVNLFGGPLVGGELIGPVEFVYDGTKWWATVVQPGVSADRTYYVNGSTGSDSNNGLSSGTAFATIQKAIDVVAAISWGGFNATISVANGTYSPNISLRQVSGAASVTLTGNIATPASVVTGLISNNGTSGWFVQGFKPTTTALGAHNVSCEGGSITLGNMEWPLNDGGGTANGGAHIAAGTGGSIFLTGTHRIAGGATIAHMFVADGGSMRFLQSSPPTLNVIATAGFSQFINVNVGDAHVTYASITGAASVTSGKKYNVIANGVINVDGAGVNYYPGPSAGTTATGGQYV